MEKERDAAMIEEIQRPAAELLYAEELQRLTAADEATPRPSGWKLTPLSVLRFILGDAAGGIAPKFVGSRSMLETRYACCMPAPASMSSRRPIPGIGA
jgi:hypothetical protein